MSPSKNKYIFAISEKSLFFILGFFVVVVLVHFNRETLIEAVAYIFIAMPMIPTFIYQLCQMTQTHN